ncbi:hypothetical protein [Aliivibrio fischeri]|uniref:hypothetical protein n=1 Tax=Aliivibrio fischeri TaxID=668 RepID=UPI001F4798B0|nr:hypothetical protein [Aliivibrio fischeri]MCE7534593.1 hypothetical protein [Aliivibrio fischeri]MCE7554059.1 hypothetical protein [Aliivibrio fischeri]MCE7557571.1 hypothetical protein [Aliivibrio fischeri]MCE7561089.1 hypothetical protein [Aliivibrio fischeri]MCE7568497.1 hypothetical protein [Aliivibrio fischeri]
MACPICFFRDDYQRNLKVGTFDFERFEERLIRYKESFLYEIGKLSTLTECTCCKSFNYLSLEQWTEDFILDINSNLNLIGDIFDDISLCYFKYVTENPRSSINYLSNYLENNELIRKVVNPIELVKVLFRARLKGDFDPQKIEEFYHIPYSKRYLVGSQRFSVSGQPMLYFGSSTLTVEKELEATTDQLYYSAFLPNYSDIYKFKIFDLKNSINNLIENALPGILGAGINISYSDCDPVSDRSKTFKSDILSYILLQICTFPTDKKCAFVPEYIIPQVLTSTLLEFGFDGLIFPSTKCFGNLKENHRFASHHINAVIFTKYNAESNYDEDLVKKFYKYTQSEKQEITSNIVIDAIEDVVNIHKSSNVNNNDYIIPLVMLKLQIEYLEGSKLNGIPYYESSTGKVELNLYMAVIHNMQEIITKREALH